MIVESYWELTGIIIKPNIDINYQKNKYTYSSTCWARGGACEHTGEDHLRDSYNHVITHWTGGQCICMHVYASVSGKFTDELLHGAIDP